MLYSLCLIMLHREYVPFIPLRCAKPQGPLDEPTFPAESVPVGFWDASAEEMFRAAKDILDIAHNCLENSLLPKSALVGFSVWSAAFVGIYSIRFPHMDTVGHLHDQAPGRRMTNGYGRSYTTLAEQVLETLAPTVPLVHGYLKLMKIMDAYFQRAPDVAWVGGGLNEYKLYERELHDFGTLERRDINTTLDKFESLTKRTDSCIVVPDYTVDATNEISQPMDTMMQSIDGQQSHPSYSMNWPTDTVQMADHEYQSASMASDMDDFTQFALTGANSTNLPGSWAFIPSWNSDH